MNRLSLSTVYEETSNNDPYRSTNKKKSPKPTTADDNNNLEFDAFHSRTASDSSTSKTVSTSFTTNSTVIGNDNYEDPYAKTSYKSKKILLSDRANSYLPYSHHERDPNQKTEPIYIENNPTTTMLHLGSLLAEPPLHTLIDLKQQQQQQQENIPNQDKPILPTTSLSRKKQNRKYCCGLTLRSILFILFICIAIITVIWYFVWPRIPTLSLQDIDNIGNIQVVTNSTTKSMSATWRLNITADNTNNWVPTRFRSIDFTIRDDETHELFGNGSITKFTLPGRKVSSILVPMTIYYASDIANDTTFQDLYNACGVQVTSNSPFENQQDLLNVTLSITFSIYGIVWPTTKYLPYTGLNCPTN